MAQHVTISARMLLKSHACLTLRSSQVSKQLEENTIREIEILINLWKSKQIPTWRVIEKIAGVILDHQKADYKENH